MRFTTDLTGARFDIRPSGAANIIETGTADAYTNGGLPFYLPRVLNGTYDVTASFSGYSPVILTVDKTDALIDYYFNLQPITIDITLPTTVLQTTLRLTTAATTVRVSTTSTTQNPLDVALHELQNFTNILADGDYKTQLQTLVTSVVGQPKLSVANILITYALDKGYNILQASDGMTLFKNGAQLPGTFKTETALILGLSEIELLNGESVSGLFNSAKEYATGIITSVDKYEALFKNLKTRAVKMLAVIPGSQPVIDSLSKLDSAIETVASLKSITNIGIQDILNTIENQILSTTLPPTTTLIPDIYLPVLQNQETPETTTLQEEDTGIQLYE